MTSLNKMYDGVANSPDTFLTSPLASGGNIMYVADSSVFGTLPNLAVLGSGANAETVLITSKRSDQGLNIQRAVEGVARDWAKASIVARNFTNYDYKQLKENINLLNNGKVDKELIDKKADKTEVVTSVNGQKGDAMIDFFRCDDTRNQNYAPKDYLLNGVRYKRNTITTSQFEFKTCKVVGVDSLITQTFCVVNTIILWNQISGGLPMQIAYGNGVMAIRTAIDENTWGEWQKVSTSNDLSEYAKSTDVPTRLSQLSDDSTHRTVSDTEKQSWNDKVDKVNGKGLSTNDYDSTAKSKVDAIPANPKYTDTVTSVVDNLTTDDGTKALSAKQGKALQDNKADKSDISRCKTKGYDTSSTWQSLGTTRDLEDWIGDFDKRTRELKSSNGGVQFFRQFVENYDGTLSNYVLWTAVKINSTVIFNAETLIWDDVSSKVKLPPEIRPSSEFIIRAWAKQGGTNEVVFKEYGFNSNGIRAINLAGDNYSYTTAPFTVSYQV